MTRAEAIREFLAGCKKPATPSEIQIGLEEMRLTEGVDRAKWANRIGAQVAQMLKAEKLVRTGMLGHYRYALAADGHIDRRLKPPTTKSGVAKRRKADKTPAPRLTPAKQVVPVTPSSLRTSMPKLSTREQLDADVAAFLAQGGRVQQLAPGESASPTRCWLEANGLAKPRKARKTPNPTTGFVDLDDVAA